MVMENKLVPLPRFTRSSTGILGGVCKAFAQRFDIDVLWVRLGFLVAVLFFGTGCGLYLLLLVSLPREDRVERAYEPRILGVCARLALKLKTDVGLTRAVSFVFLFATFGATFLLYLVLYFILPTTEESLNA